MWRALRVHPYGKIALSLALVIFYCAVRAVIYRMIPIGSFAEWIQRDTVMDVPRLVFFGLVLFFFFRGRRPGLWSAGWARMLVFGGLATGIEQVYGAFRGSYGLLPTADFCILGASSLCVGFFEEFCFRGAVLESLRPIGGAWGAATLSSLAFTLFHVQAQDISTWPSIFLFGLLCSVLRLQGVSLICLSLFHGFYDTVFFLGGSGDPHPAWLYYGELGALALSVALCRASGTFSGASQYEKKTSGELETKMGP